MKTLYLIRHAKSSWSFDLNDHDRPLGKRGRKDVLRIGEHLSLNQPKPDQIISSTASRALYTALHICDSFNMHEELIHLDKKLYHADAIGTLNVIKSAPDCERLALFGHNPGFTSLANSLTNHHFDNIPTCGAVGVTFEVKKWSDIDFGKGKLIFSYFPKALKNIST